MMDAAGLPDAPELDRVEPVNAVGLKRAVIGRRPVFKWLPIDVLRIDRTYQRGLSERSHRLIRRGVETFSWERLKALSVYDLGDGTFAILDGQHTAIIIATHGGIDAAPCMISPARDVRVAAADFVGLNSDRIALTPSQIFQAKILAQDPVAVAVNAAVIAGGGRVLRNPRPLKDYKPGDTIAIGTLAAMIRERQADLITRAIAMCIAAGVGPAPSVYLKAVAIMLAGPVGWRVSEKAIVKALMSEGLRGLQRRSRDLRDSYPLTAGEGLAKAIREIAAAG